MGNYEQLKQSVSDVIKTNGNQEITGSILQNVLLTIISSVGANATFAGIATPTTNPGTPDGSVFYLASENGVYSNFGGIELKNVLSVLLWNGSWSSQQVFGVDNVPTAESNNLVKSGGVAEYLNTTSANGLLPAVNVNNLHLYYSKFIKLALVVPSGTEDGERYTINALSCRAGHTQGFELMLKRISDGSDNSMAHAFTISINSDKVQEYISKHQLAVVRSVKSYGTLYLIVDLEAIDGKEIIWSGNSLNEVIIEMTTSEDYRVAGIKALLRCDSIESSIESSISGIDTQIKSFFSLSRNFVFDVSSNTDVNKALKEAILDAQFILSKPEWWDNSMHVTFGTREYTGVFSVTVSQMLSETNGFELKIYTENNYSYVPYFILGDLRRYKKLHDDIWVYRSFKTVAKTDDDEDITLEALMVVDESKLYNVSGIFSGNRFVANTVRYRHSGLLEAYNITSGIISDIPASYFVEFSTINFGVSGDSITANGQWANVVNSILSFNTIHNTAVGSARYACRQYTVDGVTYETQNYNDPDFVGISDGWDYTTDVLEIRKRLNNCAKVHIQKFISEVANNDYPSPDIFALAYGTNDSVPTSENTTNACSESSLSDVDLFNLAGGLRWCLETIRTTYPTCKIFVLLPIQRAGNLSSSGNANNIEKIQAIRKVCQAMSVPVINMFDECGICGILENGTGPYLRDGLHPNANGQALMGRYAANYIRNWYNKLV